VAEQEKEHPVAGIVFLAIIAASLAIGSAWLINASLKAKWQQRVLEAVKVGDQGELERSEKMLEQILVEYPGSTATMLILAGAKADRGALDEADKLLARVLDLEPQDWEAVAERASIARQKGNIDAAIVLLEKIPPGEGHLRQRMNDVEWFKYRADPRMRKLLEKHDILFETTLRHSENR
jgi:predicted Zn-dependent protease